MVAGLSRARSLSRFRLRNARKLPRRLALDIGSGNGPFVWATQNELPVLVAHRLRYDRQVPNPTETIWTKCIIPNYSMNFW